MYKKIVLGILIFMIIVCIAQISSAAEIQKGIENFPESYQPYLKELKAKHPTWEFSALYTELDFDTVIYNEYANDRNLVPKNYSDKWKCKEERKIQCRNRCRVGKCIKTGSRVYNGPAKFFK